MSLIRYMATRPETVVSIITTGKYPDLIPHYLESESPYFCFRENISDCIRDVKTTLHQIFILELSLPEENNHNFIDPKWIQKVYIYSLRGSNLINRLFGGVCPKPIIIDPNLYVFSNTALPSSKISHTDSILPASPLLIFTPSPTNSPQNEPEVMERLNTYEQHLTLLKFALQNAKKTIIITTHGVEEATIRAEDFDYLIQDAIYRGVEIYIYCEDRELIKSDLLDFLYSLDIFITEGNTHSKILAIDDAFIAAGSFNWLSAIDDQYKLNEHASLVYRGNQCPTLIDDFLKHMKYYRNLRFQSDTPLKESKDEPSQNSTPSCLIGRGSEITYLSTLEQHKNFVRNSLLTAKQRIIIFSPFISTINPLQAGFDLQDLKDTTKRGVDIYFVFLPAEVKKSNLNIHLTQINSPKIHLVPMENIRSKTFVVDDHTITEGSFNWLCATQDEEGIYHEHDVTFVTQGNIARNLIETSFDCSEIGKTFLPKAHTQQNQNTFSDNKKLK